MRKRLSSGEWAVMNALWRAGSLAAVEDVRERLGQLSSRDYRTIQTVLNRCVEKGWVRLERRQGRCFYSPAIGRRAGVEERAAQFFAEIAEGEESALRIVREALERELSEPRGDDYDGGDGGKGKKERH